MECKRCLVGMDPMQFKVQPGNMYLLTYHIGRTVREKCVAAQLNVHRYALSDPEIETHSQS